MKVGDKVTIPIEFKIAWVNADNKSSKVGIVTNDELYSLTMDFEVLEGLIEDKPVEVVTDNTTGLQREISLLWDSLNSIDNTIQLLKKAVL